MAGPPDSGEGAVTEYENAVPRRGRPPKITRDQIIDAVLASGFSGLTIPALAQRLGVTTMTIYRHAATRSELLAMAWEKVLERHTWPDCDGPWRRLLHEHATTLWDLLADHPGAAIELSSAVLPSRMINLYDDLSTALVDQGFAVFDAILAVDTIIDLTIDHRRGIETLMQTVDNDKSISLYEKIRASWISSDETMTPQRKEVRTTFNMAIEAPPREWFHKKLALILDGLALRHENSNNIPYE